MTTIAATPALSGDTRLSTAHRVFQAALAVNSALTLLCAVTYFTGFGASLVGSVTINGDTALRVPVGGRWRALRHPEDPRDGTR